MPETRSMARPAQADWEVPLPRVVAARLVHFSTNGEYTTPPIALEGGIVMDEDHGWVLEVVLPMKGIGDGECAVLIPITELHGCPMSAPKPR